jgi:hypothetical protein
MSQESIACDIRLRIGMLTAIDLDHQLGLEAGKVDDIRPHRMLAPESMACQLPQAQVFPQGLLGVRHVAAQLTRLLGFLAVPHGADPP